MPRLPRLSIVMGMFLASCLGGSLLIHLLFSTNLVYLIWLIMHALILPMIMFGMDRKWGLQALSWIIPHTQLVHTLDNDGEMRHALAYGEPGDILTAHVFWLGEIGKLYLHPNGYVQGASYVYFWEPVNTDDQIQMHLTYNCKELTQIQHMAWMDKEDYRLLLKTQTKLIT
jgi:hypothetical protein